MRSEVVDFAARNKQMRDGTVAFVFAHDGIEALQSIEQNPHVDMVVSDINMPRMDGLSLLQKLQEADDKLSTVIVSAYGDMSNIRTAMNRGAFDFLTKPIDFSDLELTVEKTIRHVVAMREARRRQAEAERAHASLSRYFSPQIAAKLASDGGSPGMEVHRPTLRQSSQRSPASPHSWKVLSPRCWARCSTNTSEA
jgi:YesN/AraC family two-component response regulator